MSTLLKEIKLQKRHRRLRKRLLGTGERPRLCVHRSNLNLQVQLVDDYAGRSVFSLSSLTPAFRKQVKCSASVKAAKEFGHFLADEMKEKKLKKVIFDRGGFLYHGRIRALAESLRENGIEF